MELQNRRLLSHYSDAPHATSLFGFKHTYRLTAAVKTRLKKGK